MKAKTFLSALFFLAIITAEAQSTFIPKNLGDAINTVYDEVNPVISHDKKTLYFTRKNHPQNASGVKNSADIWIANQQEDGSWSEAQRATALNSGRNNYVLSVTSDNNTLLTFTDDVLSIATRNGNDWSAPQKLNLKATKEATLSADGKNLLVSKGGKLVRYQRAASGEWEAAETLEGIKEKVGAPFLLADNKTIFFVSTRKGKKTDIFKVQRVADDWKAWSMVSPLNDTINSNEHENFISADANGAWAYFSSTNNTMGGSDIFKVKLYEDQPYVLVSGKVVNAKSKRALTKRDIIIKGNGETIESAVNRDSGSYTVKLPFGKVYSLTAQVYEYQAKPQTIDASKDKEFRAVKLDLEEVPGAFALLKGKLLIKNTDKVIPAHANPKIVIDGEQVDSANVDATKGTYSVKLPHGTTYFIQVLARHFESLPDLVDLKGVDGYEEIVFDLHADAEKMAVVSGKIIDLKTSKPVDPLIPVEVRVEGVSSVAAVVDSTTREYELRFPVREQYTISAVAPGYYPIYETIDVKRQNTEVKISHDLFIVPIERGQSIRLNNIFFEPGKATLSSTSHAELDRLVSYLEAHPSLKIQIDSHTNPSIKATTLNEARAVANYIISKGISRHRVGAHGYGSTKPLASNKTPEGRQLNRRVEFLIIDE